MYLLFRWFVCFTDDKKGELPWLRCRTLVSPVCLAVVAVTVPQPDVSTAESSRSFIMHGAGQALCCRDDLQGLMNPTHLCCWCALVFQQNLIFYFSILIFLAVAAGRRPCRAAVTLCTYTVEGKITFFNEVLVLMCCLTSYIFSSYRTADSTYSCLNVSAGERTFWKITSLPETFYWTEESRRVPFSERKHRDENIALN